MRIKICGLTRAEDAVLAQNLGAWALGFVFAEQSKRRVTASQAGDIIVALRHPAIIAGVFVNQTAEALEIAKQIPLSALQLHGDESPDDCARAGENFPGLIIKALRPVREEDLRDIARYKNAADYILIDAAAPGQYGGTGQTANWDLAALAAQGDVPVILAGGLNAANLAEAARRVRPYALDLSGGVEAGAGVKDAGKLGEVFGVGRKL